MKGKHYFDLEAVNKIKCERHQQFDDSMFSDVYSEAVKLVKEIIYSNESYKKWDSIDRFANEDQIPNVIAFLGERGMGKSSAMLSIAYFLKEYYIESSKVLEKYKIDKDGNVEFYVLSKIDAAMMGAGENLFDVVLAKMWDDFSIKANSGAVPEELCRRTKDKFNDVKQSYMEYKNQLKDNEKLSKGSQLTELHKLSKSLNLRSDFLGLVKAFLECVQIKFPGNIDNYLVISIDDLDIVKDDAYDILEQIRSFFTIPQVIILITADMNRLELDVSSLFARQLLYSENVKDGQLKMVSEYAHNYLAKIIPRNTRIYMPVLNDVDGRLLVPYNNKLKKMYQGNPEDDITEKSLTLDILVKYMNIIMYPQFSAYSNRHKSLRNMVNNVDELLNIVGGEEENIYDEIYQWSQKELFITCDKIEDENLRDFINMLLKSKVNMYNYYISNWVFPDLPIEKTVVNEAGYGRSLIRMAELEKTYFQDTEFFWMLIWIYSLSVSRLLQQEKGELRLEEDIIVNDVFLSSERKEGATSGMGHDRNVAAVMSLELDKADTARNLILSNSKVIVDKFKMLLLFDFDYVLENLEIKESGYVKSNIGKDLEWEETKKEEASQKNEEKKTANEENTHEYNILEILFMAVNSVISVDNFIRNIIHYKEKWNTYFNKICEVVGAAAKEEVQEKGELCIELENIEKLNIDKFQQWKEKFGVEKITDLLPFQDVGVMLEISKDIKNMPEVKSGKEIERVYESMKIIERNFAKAESSYELSRLKKDNLNYSERIHEILEIVDICSVSEELKNDLKVQYQTDDTVIA